MSVAYSATIEVRNLCLNCYLQDPRKRYAGSRISRVRLLRATSRFFAPKSLTTICVSQHAPGRHPPGGHWNAFLFDAKNFARKWDPGIIISKKVCLWSPHVLVEVVSPGFSVVETFNTLDPTYNEFAYYEQPVISSRFFSQKETSMFKKFGYNQYRLQRAYFHELNCLL